MSWSRVASPQASSAGRQKTTQMKDAHFNKTSGRRHAQENSKIQNYSIVRCSQRLACFYKKSHRKAAFLSKISFFFFRIQTTIEREDQGDPKLQTQKREVLDYVVFGKVICNKGQVHLWLIISGFNLIIPFGNTPYIKTTTESQNRSHLLSRPQKIPTH